MVGNSCDKTRRAPVRPIKPTKRSVSGVFPFRGEGGIPYESMLERDFLLRTEFSSDVLAIISQPVSIPFTTNGRSYKYTPDFLVYYRLGDRHFEDYPKPMLVEVKPETEWRKNWRSWLPKWKANGWRRKEKGRLVEIKNEDLWRRLDELLRVHRVRFVHVRGHSGHPENERCDTLAVAAYQKYR